MSQQANTFELISATIPIRALRPLWNVLTELGYLEVRDQLFVKFRQAVLGWIFSSK